MRGSRFKQPSQYLWRCGHDRYLVAGYAWSGPSNRHSLDRLARIHQSRQGAGLLPIDVSRHVLAGVVVDGNRIGVKLVGRFADQSDWTARLEVTRLA